MKMLDHCDFPKSELLRNGLTLLLKFYVAINPVIDTIN